MTKKHKLGDNYYVTVDVVKNIIVKGKSDICKECRLLLKNNNIVNPIQHADHVIGDIKITQNTQQTIIDITNNVFTYDGIQINTIFDKIMNIGI